MKSVFLYPSDIKYKLEFDYLFQLLEDYCISDLGKEKLNQLEFSYDNEKIIQNLTETSEFIKLRENGLYFPTENYHNLSEILKLLVIKESVLDPEDFLKIVQLVKTIKKIAQLLINEKEAFPLLVNQIAELKIDNKLILSIEVIIDEEGIIKSSASNSLSIIRKKISAAENEITTSFKRVINHCRNQGWLSDEEQSIRHGDRVLAVKSKFKKQVKGIVVDESATGKTVFILHESIIEQNNKLFTLREEEKREIRIILKNLSNIVRSDVDNLYEYQNKLGIFDFIRAKSILAEKMNACQPKISSKCEIDLIQAFHPVLLLQNLQKSKRTIANDITLDHENRILVISGPNAGGKSICMKTAGLIQLMIQAGLLVPVNSNSTIGIFQKIFVDIGDNQSIENDLSTYSGKLKGMKFFIDNSDKNTLFLIDEFGSGTDPEIGGVIAESILDELNKKSAFGIVTTHYSNLKIFASEINGLINGSMLFNTEKLTPSFLLEIGKPGSSYTFEILNMIGFDKDFIIKTQKKSDSARQSFDKLLIDLQREKLEINELKKSLEYQQSDLSKLLEENKNLKTELSSNRKKILSQAKDNAEMYLNNLNRQFDKLINDWNKEQDQEKKQLKSLEIKEKLVKEKTVVRKAKDKMQQKPKPVIKKNEEIKVGNHVLLEGYSEIGIVDKINKNLATVVFGNIRTKTELHKLTLVVNVSKAATSKVHFIKKESNEKGFNPTIDIRGSRRDEAIKITEEFLDQALMLNFKSLRIIHGHGDGILREAIRSQLKSYSFVTKISSETMEFGGDGVTLFEIE